MIALQVFNAVFKLAAQINIILQAMLWPKVDLMHQVPK